MKQEIASGIGPTYTGSTTLVAESPHLIERCWRVLTGNGHIVTCGIYWTHDAPGVELRVGHDDVSFFKNERVASNEVARALAMTWLLGRNSARLGVLTSAELALLILALLITFVRLSLRQ